MTKILNEPETFAATALAGFCAAHAGTVRPVSGGVLRASAVPDGKVALVVGGGSGHYPAFAGYVGPGLADAAVAGDVFASPSARAIRHVARLAERDGGVVLGFGNYAGDVLNFGLAAELLRAEGIDVRVLAVSDDIASASGAEHERRRGIAGDLVVFKIAGAAAQAGQSLDAVEKAARHANARTRSFGVAFSGCVLPGATEQLFSVPPGRIAIGLGIHGEPGIEERPLMRATELADLLVTALLKEAPERAGNRVAAVLNGLGSTKWEELFVLWTAIAGRLQKEGLELVAPEVGEFVTSLDMAGCSLTLTWLDETLEPLWLAECDTPVLRRGAIIATEPAPAPKEDDTEVALTAAPDADAAKAGALAARAIGMIAARMAEAEAELGRLDAVAGDGDHGQGMARGSASAAEAVRDAGSVGAGPASVLAAAGEAWAARAGGTSGALWGVGLVAWARMLSDDGPVTRDAVARGAMAALDGVKRLGGARPGDKTLVDALEPFATTLGRLVGEGQAITEAWPAAAEAATRAAKETANLSPRLGRARPLAERSKGHPDPGAISLALCLRTVGELITQPQG
jgi:D-erythrulose 4-kinase